MTFDYCMVNKINIVAVVASGYEVPNVPKNVLDSDVNTRWSQLGKGSNIVLDLGSDYNITEVDIGWFKGNERKNHFDIAVGPDSSSLTSVLAQDSTGTTVINEAYQLKASASGRFVRITVNGNTVNDWASITSVTVFGVNSTGKRVQTRETLEPGEAIPDDEWTVTADTGPLPFPHTCPDKQHWDDALGKCVDDVIPCPTGEHRDPVTGLCVPDPVSTGVDVFGISKMYADRQGTYNNWVQTTAGDPRFFEGRVADSGNGWLKAAGGSTEIRIEVLSDITANENTIETFDVGKVITKGYLYKPIDSADGKGDFGDFEMTWRVRGKAGTGTQNGECHVELVPGGYRQTSDMKLVGKDKAVPAACEAMSYHYNLYPLTGRVKFEKDSMHTPGYTKTNPEKKNAMGKFDNMQEIIQKAVLYRTTKGVKLESYVDESGTGTQFKKVIEFEDTGQYGPTRGGNAPCKCGEFPILSMGRVALGYRGDNWISLEFKDASIRSIDSTKPLHAAHAEDGEHDFMTFDDVEHT